MLIRLACSLALVVLAVAPGAAQGDCAQAISRLMSKDTEKLATRYQRVSKRIERQGASPSLVAEGCRIARALEPRLIEQIAALKQSGCTKDPSAGTMVTDIVRGYEDDLAAMRKATRADCR
jgi:hypothetical protein